MVTERAGYGVLKVLSKHSTEVTAKLVKLVVTGNAVSCNMELRKIYLNFSDSQQYALRCKNV
jgi:hypothetical protein